MHTATAPSDVLFCERNNRLWVGVLATTSVLVLAMAVWLSLRDRPTELDDHLVQHSVAPMVHPNQSVAIAPATPVNPSAALVPAPAAADPTDPVATATMIAPPPAPAAVQVAAPLGRGPAMQLQDSFNQVAETIRPCVVNVNAVRPARRQLGRANSTPQFIDPFDGVPDKMIGKTPFESVGSGVIVDAAGYVVTNDHVVGDAVAIMVTRFDDPNPVTARLVATDRSRDLALLKLDIPTPVPAAKLANSSEVLVGDWVLAVGNPFGLGHTVTAGIISGRRSLDISGVRYKDLLQTDAPINRGSSGGPLVNLQGEVVGINTAIYAPTGVFSGMGFAIPSNHVGAFIASAMAQANAGGEVPATPPTIAPVPTPQTPIIVEPSGSSLTAPQPARGSGAWFGIQGSQVTPAVAQAVGLSRAEGVFVNSVDPASPASDADVRNGDVIVDAAGQPVRDPESLTSIINALPPGLAIPVGMWRNGQRMQRRVKLGYRGVGTTGSPGGAR